MISRTRMLHLRSRKFFGRDEPYAFGSAELVEGQLNQRGLWSGRWESNPVLIPPMLLKVRTINKMTVQNRPKWRRCSSKVLPDHIVVGDGFLCGGFTIAPMSEVWEGWLLSNQSVYLLFRRPAVC